MINTLSKINLSKIGWEGGRSTSIWIMSLNILFFWGGVPLSNLQFSLSDIPTHNQLIPGESTRNIG